MKATERRSQDDIIREIAEKLGLGDGFNRDIYDAANNLCRLQRYPSIVGYRKDNQDYAEKLRQWAKEGMALLTDPPEGVDVLMLFASENHPQLTVPDKEMYRKTFKEFTSVFGGLAMLEKRCDWIINSQIGLHGNAGYQQWLAATGAKELMQKYGKDLAYSSPTSIFREVASLLYEAMTGDYGRDLERACETIARAPIGTEKQ